MFHYRPSKLFQSKGYSKIFLVPLRSTAKIFEATPLTLKFFCVPPPSPRGATEASFLNPPRQLQHNTKNRNDYIAKAVSFFFLGGTAKSKLFSHTSNTADIQRANRTSLPPEVRHSRPHRPQSNLRQLHHQD